MEDEDVDAEWEDDAEGTGPAAESDPRQLRNNYEELSRAVRSLEKRGGFAQGSTALRALEEARDRAEKAWRSAKPPAPLPTRMVWAETKLERAAAALTKARLAVDELDAEYEKRRELLDQKIHEAEAWYGWRKQQVDDMHREAAEKAPARRSAQVGGAGAEVKERIRDQLLPEVQEIMEHAEGNPELLEKLSMLAAGLVDAETRLEGSPNAPAAETFDMAEADSDGGDWEGTARGATSKGGEGRAQGKGGDDTGGSKGKSSGWRPEGPGRWSRATTAGKAGSATAETTAHATAAAEAGQTKGETGAEGRAAASSKSEGDAMANQDCGMDSGGAVSDREEGGPPKHRRRTSADGTSDETREAADRRRAQELHAQQTAAAAAQVESFNAGAGGFGSQAALSIAAQRFVGEVQSAQERAVKRGIVPRTGDGRALLELAPMELQKWVEENLDADAD